MIPDIYKKIFNYSISILMLVLGILSVKTFIDNKVAQTTQNLQEICEKQKADIKIDLEREKINKESEYQKEILLLREQLEKAKLVLKKIEDQKKYSNLIKKDVGQFIKEVDTIFGIKGDQSVKK